MDNSKWPYGTQCNKRRGTNRHAAVRNVDWRQLARFMIYKSAQIEGMVIRCTSDSNTLFYYTIDANLELYTSINAMLIVGENAIVDAYRRGFVAWRNTPPIDFHACMSPWPYLIKLAICPSP